MPIDVHRCLYLSYLLVLYQVEFTDYGITHWIPKRGSKGLPCREIPLFNSKGINLLISKERNQASTYTGPSPCHPKSMLLICLGVNRCMNIGRAWRPLTFLAVDGSAWGMALVVIHIHTVTSATSNFSCFVSNAARDRTLKI